MGVHALRTPYKENITYVKITLVPPMKREFQAIEVQNVVLT